MPDQGEGPAREAASRRFRLRRRRVQNPDARMPLMEHIRELRNRVLRAALAITAGSVAGWYAEPAVWHVIQEPYCKLPHKLVAAALATSPHANTCTLYVTGLFDALFLRLKLAIAIGIVVTAPIWLYQLWAFVAPGLHARERRWAYFFAGAAVPLFATGSTIAYVAMTKGLRFLLELLPQNTAPIITINTYLGYAIAMLAIFGLSFELPLVVVLLNLAGVLTHKRFVKWRRMIIFLIFAFAAVATPSPDPISMLLLAVPCVVLVEAAEVFAWANDRRRARRGTVYPGLTAEEVTEYGLDTDPVADEVDAGR